MGINTTFPEGTEYHASRIWKLSQLFLLLEIFPVETIIYLSYSESDSSGAKRAESLLQLDQLPIITLLILVISLPMF